MGWQPTLRRSSIGIGPSFSFLASEHSMFKRAGITVDESTVGADADGLKLLHAGTLMGEIAATGKFGAYSNGASDGRQTAVGFLLDTIDLTNGDVVTTLLIHGSVIESRTSGVDSSGKADLAGAIIFQ